MTRYYAEDCEPEGWDPDFDPRVGMLLLRADGTIPRAAPPSWAEGYARSAFESAYPSLWNGLTGAWVPQSADEPAYEPAQRSRP